MVLCAHVQCFAARAQATDCCYKSRSIPDQVGPIRWQETRLTKLLNKLGINRDNKFLTDNLTNNKLQKSDNHQDLQERVHGQQICDRPRTYRC